MRVVKFIILAIVLAVSFYWVKCQLGINIIPDFTWEEHFPVLDVFQKRETLVRPRPGVIFSSSFDELLPYLPWSAVWSRDKGAVRDAVLPGGLEGSKQLVFTSVSEKDWAFQSSVLVEAKPGQIFSLDGYARASAGAVGEMSIVLYDSARKVIKWNYAGIKISSPDWKLAASRFIVPGGAVYIRFRLVGRGVGQCCFDNVSFRFLGKDKS